MGTAQVVSLAAITVLALALRLQGVNRQGFSPDEPLTFFAVEGIHAHGLPQLPSGAIYVRGFLYSYVSWAASVPFGRKMVVYRTVSAVAGAALVPLAYGAAGGGLPGAAMAATLAVHPSLVTSADWARFYGAFMTLSVAWVLTARNLRGRTAAALLVLGAARLTHEYAVVLLAVPGWTAICAADPGRRRAAARLVVYGAIEMSVIQILVLLMERGSGALASAAGAHAFAIQAAEALYLPRVSILMDRAPVGCAALAAAFMVTAWRLRCRTQVPAVFALAVATCAAACQLGVMAAATVLTALARPRSTYRLAAWWASGALIGVAAETTATMTFTASAFYPQLPWMLARGSLSYPFDAVVFLGSLDPGLAVLVVLSCAAASVVLTRGDDLPSAMVTPVVISLLLFGAINMGFAEVYFALLIPIAAVAAGAAANAAGRARIPLALAACVLLLTSSARMGHLRALTPEMPNRWVMETYASPAWRAAGDQLASTTVLISNDELACGYLLRVPDYWVPASEQERRRFAMTVGGAERGIYSGAPVLATADALDAVIATAHSPVMLVAVPGRFNFSVAANMLRDAAHRFGGTVIVDGPDLLIAAVNPTKVP